MSSCNFETTYSLSKSSLFHYLPSLPDTFVSSSPITRLAILYKQSLTRIHYNTHLYTRFYVKNADGCLLAEIIISTLLVNNHHVSVAGWQVSIPYKSAISEASLHTACYLVSTPNRHGKAMLLLELDILIYQ